MFSEMLGEQASDLLTAALIAAAAVLVLWAVLWSIRRQSTHSFARAGQSHQPRLAVLDATAVDARRRLVLIRRDTIEHLVMIGGPSDVVIESGIRALVPRRLGEGGVDPAQSEALMSQARKTGAEALREAWAERSSERRARGADPVMTSLGSAAPAEEPAASPAAPPVSPPDPDPDPQPPKPGASAPVPTPPPPEPSAAPPKTTSAPTAPAASPQRPGSSPQSPASPSPPSVSPPKQAAAPPMPAASMFEPTQEPFGRPLERVSSQPPIINPLPDWSKPLAPMSPPPPPKAPTPPPPRAPVPPKAALPATTRSASPPVDHSSRKTSFERSSTEWEPIRQTSRTPPSRSADRQTRPAAPAPSRPVSSPASNEPSFRSASGSSGSKRFGDSRPIDDRTTRAPLQSKPLSDNAAFNPPGRDSQSGPLRRSVDLAAKRDSPSAGDLSGVRPANSASTDRDAGPRPSRRSADPGGHETSQRSGNAPAPKTNLNSPGEKKLSLEEEMNRLLGQISTRR